MLPPAEVGREAELVSVAPAVKATVRPESGQVHGSPCLSVAGAPDCEHATQSSELGHLMRPVQGWSDSHDVSLVPPYPAGREEGGEGTRGRGAEEPAHLRTAPS